MTTTNSAEALTSELSTNPVLTTAMTSNVRGPVLLVAALVAGLQAGTYFTWATGVMPGLAKVDDRTFVHAMQQMNIAIVNPVFIATFLGAPLLAGAVDRRGRPARPPVGDRRDRARRRHPRHHASPATSRSTTPSTPPARSTRSRTSPPSAPTSSRSG